MKIKQNDTIIVLQGKDRGKKGKVLKAYPALHKVLVEKLNMVKKHLKPSKATPHAGITEIERPLPISRVMFICPHCNQPTRIAHLLSQNGKTVRKCKKCHAAIDQEQR